MLLCVGGTVGVCTSTISFAYSQSNETAATVNKEKISC